MTPHEQKAAELVHYYYEIYNGSPISDVVNRESLIEATERAKWEVAQEYVRYNELFWKQVLEQLHKPLSL
jgi:hypothetical protein